jgi:hypothetical protein
MDEKSHYHSYLLRFWQAIEEGKNPVWRFSLEDPRTREQHGFADLEALFAFLEDIIQDSHLAAGLLKKLG